MASLAIVFTDAVAAGLFLVVGLLSIAGSAWSWQDVKSFSISPASVTAEFREQVDRAVEILKRIEEVEAGILFVLSEQILNKGGHRYVGGYGEEARFNIVRALSENEQARSDPRTAANLMDLKRQLGFHLLYGVIGTRNRDQVAPNTLGQPFSLTQDRPDCAISGHARRRWRPEPSAAGPLCRLFCK